MLQPTNLLLAGSNSFTLQTYYPAPYGAYDQLMLVPRTGVPSAGCVTHTLGMMYVNDADNILRVCQDDGTGNLNWFAMASWDFNSSNKTLTLSAFDTKVGIGTVNPETTLQVGEAIKFSNVDDPTKDPDIEFMGSASIVSEGDLHLIVDANNDYSGNGGLIIGKDSYTTNGTFKELMRVTDNGNVGVGVDDPTEKMEVDGGIKGRRVTATEGVVVGNVTNPVAGAIRFNGSDFEGYTGTSWTSLTMSSGNSTEITGNNPTCPTGTIEIQRNWISKICSNQDKDRFGRTMMDCPSRCSEGSRSGEIRADFSCTTGGGWQGISSIPSCTFRACDQGGGQCSRSPVECNADEWNAVRCL